MDFFHSRTKLDVRSQIYSGLMALAQILCVCAQTLCRALVNLLLFLPNDWGGLSSKRLRPSDLVYKDIYINVTSVECHRAHANKTTLLLSNAIVMLFFFKSLQFSQFCFVYFIERKVCSTSLHIHHIHLAIALSSVMLLMY